MTAPKTSPLAAALRRNMDYVKWLVESDSTLRDDAEAKAERAFLRLHGDARYRARIYL